MPAIIPWGENQIMDRCHLHTTVRRSTTQYSLDGAPYIQAASVEAQPFKTNSCQLLESLVCMKTGGLNPLNQELICLADFFLLSQPRMPGRRKHIAIITAFVIIIIIIVLNNAKFSVTCEDWFNSITIKSNNISMLLRFSVV